MPVEVKLRAVLDDVFLSVESEPSGPQQSQVKDRTVDAQNPVYSLRIANTLQRMYLWRPARARSGIGNTPFLESVLDARHQIRIACCNKVWTPLCNLTH